MEGDAGCAMARVLEIALKSDYDELGRICISVNEFLESHELSPRVLYGVNLALEEILTNIFKYGYDDECKDHDISVRLEVEGPGVSVQIVDDGNSFDLEQAPEPDLSTPISERTIGGLGIHLVRNMLDTINYQRVDDKNIIELSIKGEAACSGKD
ncbi:ATP-binding protein [Desulfatibacillum aliphaticivorans]|nr:ATP-binding protein [Desulfatibacillum aliphaticivorans]